MSPCVNCKAENVSYAYMFYGALMIELQSVVKLDIFVIKSFFLSTGNRLSIFDLANAF